MRASELNPVRKIAVTLPVTSVAKKHRKILAVRVVNGRRLHGRSNDDLAKLRGPQRVRATVEDGTIHLLLVLLVLDSKGDVCSFNPVQFVKLVHILLRGTSFTATSFTATTSTATTASTTILRSGDAK
jgi:hypothetical protein